MKLVGKILLAAVAYVVGTSLMGMISIALHLSPPPMPAGTTQAGLFKAMLVGSVILMAGLTPLALGLGGRRWVRWGALAALAYVACGLNTALEASIFFTPSQGFAFQLVNYIGPFALSTLVLALSFGGNAQANGLPKYGAAQWAWRVAVAWLAFPIIYWTFGMCVAPFVVPYYNAGVAGLVIPKIHVIVAMQMLRSPLFLMATLPVIALWAGSRKGLFISLGVAHAAMVGLYGLAQAYWFPTVIRVAHSIEITADSFAYAAVLVWLFARKAKGEVPELAKAAGAK